MKATHYKLAITVTSCLIILLLQQLLYDPGDKKLEAHKRILSQSRLINQTKENDVMKERPDEIDDSGALVYLKAYGKRHQSNVSDDLDPNDPTKVTTWWQAVAMVDWFFTGDLRQNCQNKTWFGNKLICQDQKWKVTPPCLVYSFGINNNFKFDDAMAKLGCEVHAFDPSMNESGHQRKSGVTFHDLGLSHVDSDSYEPRSDRYVHNARHTIRWKIRTLESIMKMLGHKGQILDVLKIDIEANEWDVVRQLMSSDILGDIRQMNIEWHLFHGGKMGNFPPLEDYLLSYRTIRALRSLGWREISSNKCCYSNFSNGVNIQSEIAYVNHYFDA